MPWRSFMLWDQRCPIPIKATYGERCRYASFVRGLAAARGERSTGGWERHSLSQRSVQRLRWTRAGLIGLWARHSHVWKHSKEESYEAI